MTRSNSLMVPHKAPLAGLWLYPQHLQSQFYTFFSHTRQRKHQASKSSKTWNSNDLVWVNFWVLKLEAGRWNWRASPLYREICVWFSFGICRNSNLKYSKPSQNEMTNLCLGPAWFLASQYLSSSESDPQTARGWILSIDWRFGLYLLKKKKNLYFSISKEGGS